MVRMAFAQDLLILALYGLLLELPTGCHATDTRQPRLRLSHKELWDLNRTSVFHSPFGYLGLHIMLLDEYQERLFVGGRDLLYSLRLDRVSDNYREIHWPSTPLQTEECIIKGRDADECANYIRVLHRYNRTHLLACGTGAFDPLCTFIRAGHPSEFTELAERTQSLGTKYPFETLVLGAQESHKAIFHSWFAAKDYTKSSISEKPFGKKTPSSCKQRGKPKADFYLKKESEFDCFTDRFAQS